MKRNDLIRNQNGIYRVLDITEQEVLIIDCLKQTMPVWIDTSVVSDAERITEEELHSATDICLPHVENIAPEDKAIMHHRFTMISSVIPVIGDKEKRAEEIAKTSEQKVISKQSVRKYLCIYLVYQNKACLAPLRVIHDKPLTEIEKAMRWGLNKFFYNKNKNSLTEAYTMLIKAKFTDENGRIVEEFPTIHQFRYFYRKTRKMQNYYISRDGLKDYQRNNRPLTGDGVQEFANHVGIGMLDSTICDIYLVNEAGQLIGRPLLAAAVDAYSGLCIISTGV